MKKGKRFQADVDIWLVKAFDDLKWANYGLKGKFYPQVCFGAQQAAEKALKAYLLFCNKIPPKTHSLIKLLEECVSFDNQFIRFKDNLNILDKYYAPTRYPDVDFTQEFSKDKAQESLMIATDILNYVKSKI